MALIFLFKCTLKCCLQFVSIWTSLKILSSGNGLMLPSDGYLTFYQTTGFWTQSNSKHLQMTNVANIMISVFDRAETLWDKEKMLVTSIISFSHKFFKRLLFQGG